MAEIKVPLEKKLLLSIDEAVEHTGIERNSIIDLMHDETTGIGRRIGRAYRVYRPALDDYVRENPERAQGKDTEDNGC